MVPSALRLPAFAVLALAVALFAFPALGEGAAGERADARPDATALSVQPTVELKATATLAREADQAAGAPAAAAPQRLQARAVPDSAAPAPRSYRIARIRAGRTVQLRSKPAGSVVAALSSRTEFGTKRVLAVAEVRGRWLGVMSPERPNGRLGWIDGSSGAVDRGRTKVSLRADLSERRVDLRVGDKVVERLKVAIGRPGSSTPTGRFAITDKLAGGRFGPYYGCCILAMSGTQPNLPAGWRGGNRLAVHGTNSPGTIGMASSAGCLRAADRDLRALMRRVPVGTTIFVRR